MQISYNAYYYIRIKRVMIQKNKKKRKTALYLFYGLITIAILFTILWFNDFEEIGQVMANTDTFYIGWAVLLLAVYAALYPLTNCIYAKARKLPVSFGTVYCVGMTEHFFNGITPFATGGQPFQIYALTKAKVKVSESTAIMMMNFITFMLVTNIFSLLSLIYYSRFVTNTAMAVLAIIGFTMNFGILCFLIALSTSKGLRNALSWLLVKLSHIKFLKKFLEPRLDDFDAYVDRVQIGFKSLFKRLDIFFLCFFLKAITMAIYYSMTYFILRSLGIGVTINDLFFIMCGTSFAITMVVFLPTPGSSGGIEFAFQSVFSSLAGGTIAAVASSGMLIWRLLTYYLMMIVSFLFYVGLEIYFNIKAKKAVQAELEEEESENLDESVLPSQDEEIMQTHCEQSLPQTDDNVCEVGKSNSNSTNDDITQGD